MTPPSSTRATNKYTRETLADLSIVLRPRHPQDTRGVNRAASTATQAIRQCGILECARQRVPLVGSKRCFADPVDLQASARRDRGPFGLGRPAAVQKFLSATHARWNLCTCWSIVCHRSPPLRVPSAFGGRWWTCVARWFVTCASASLWRNRTALSFAPTLSCTLGSVCAQGGRC